MKRIIYLFEILIYIAAFVLAAFHWYRLYEYDYYKGAFIHIAAFLAYGVFIVVRLIGLFSKFETVPKDLRNKILLLFFGCMLLLSTFVLSFSAGELASIICTVAALTIFFISAKLFRGKAFVKLIITFIILVAVLLLMAFFLGLSNSAHILISDLTEAEVKAYNIKMFLKSVGGAAAYGFIPIIAAFWLTDIFTDEIILENADSDGSEGGKNE